MRSWPWALLAAAAMIGIVAPAAPAKEPAPATTDVRALAGWSLYDRYCLACHGSVGDGGGPASGWLWPRPRDLTSGEMKWRSTPVGEPALDEDLTATIRLGVPGLMPAFGDALDDAQVGQLVEVVRGFGPAAARPTPKTRARAVPTAPAGGADAARGATLWAEAGCASAGCHVDSVPALRRPRAGGDDLAAAYRSIAWGLSGTAMPGFEQALPADDLWALAAHVIASQPAPDPHFPGRVPQAAIDRDRDDPETAAGYWIATTRTDDAGELAVWGDTIRLQGEPPSELTPAQASLSSRQCARCHAKQVREWQGSIHSEAASPGLLAQIGRIASGESVESCLRCHAPLAEQQPRLRAGQRHGATDEADGEDPVYQANPAYDEDLKHEGLTCAACHVRDWTRHGPTAVSDSLLPLPSYPKQPVAIYERADFCMPCHQLPPRLAVEGRPLLDTYREWMLGPYMKAGVQCQHCHMPNREHTFKGIHDPDTFRQGYEVETIAARGTSGVVSVRARLWNRGAGHMLPTTPTPAAWLEIALVDAAGKPIKGASASRRIGRKIEPSRKSPSGWLEHEDTRVPPGRSIEVAGGWKNGRVAEATHVRVTVRVHPDDYYEWLYETRLKDKRLDAETRAGFEEALARAIGNRYVAEEYVVEIDVSPAR